MKKRVFWSLLLSCLFVIILTSVLIITVMYTDFSEDRKNELEAECHYIAAALIQNDNNYFKDIEGNKEKRITFISGDGKVLYDNTKNADTLENHLDRPEIKAAIQNGFGEATRLSDTIGKQTYYFALRLENGNVLRLSTNADNIIGVLDNTLYIIILAVLLAFFLSVAAARVLTKVIVKPINTLNLDNPLSNNTYPELSSLLIRMDKQNKRISEQIAELEVKQNEFTAITENMSESLIIFGSDKYVLTANKSARELFGLKNPLRIGYLSLCRDEEFTRTVEDAFSGKPASGRLQKNGRLYQLLVTPVIGDQRYAAVMFAVDITEKEHSEKIRREFSANVSHELKTPLTSIMGYAEIIKSGIAKSEDFPLFAENIYAESQRLLTLIEDIIKLSRLDEEGLKNEFNLYDIYSIAEVVISELKEKAEKNKITLSIAGRHSFVYGIERTLHEMIYNLCDNAITYNKPGGNVFINVSNINDKTVLKVKDTGIGIPAEHQPRIFERFYRVDKSRSKETGGTGLGLSIVKHAAILHGADIKLKSILDEGTTITVYFDTKNPEAAE